MHIIRIYIKQKDLGDYWRYFKTVMKKYLSKKFCKRFVWMLIGVCLISLGIAFLRLSGFGTDPFSCLNFGLSRHLPISFGTCQGIVGIIIFIPVLIIRPQSFGVGAVFNMIGSGYIVDLYLWLFGKINITVETLESILLIRVLFLMMGILVVCLGAALYMQSDLGVSPYDMIGQIVEDKTNGKIKFRWARMFLDIMCVLIGFVAGATVGIGTLFMACFTGTLISWFRTNVAKKVLGDEI